MIRVVIPLHQQPRAMVGVLSMLFEYVIIEDVIGVIDVNNSYLCRVRRVVWRLYRT
jgi:hypothetical protein